jgi:hypothetical protein
MNFRRERYENNVIPVIAEVSSRQRASPFTLRIQSGVQTNILSARVASVTDKIVREELEP